MTKQEVFNKVKTHLLTQNAKSYSYEYSGMCVYRGPNGLMCAVGCLIPDELYVPQFDTFGTLENVLNAIGLSEHIALLCRLQKIHDQNKVEEWEDRLKLVATSENLAWE